MLLDSKCPPWFQEQCCKPYTNLYTQAYKILLYKDGWENVFYYMFIVWGGHSTIAPRQRIIYVVNCVKSTQRRWMKNFAVTCCYPACIKTSFVESHIIPFYEHCVGHHNHHPLTIRLHINHINVSENSL